MSRNLWAIAANSFAAGICISAGFFNPVFFVLAIVNVVLALANIILIDSRGNP